MTEALSDWRVLAKVLLTLQRHFSALTQCAHVASRFCGRKRRGTVAFDGLRSPRRPLAATQHHGRSPHTRMSSVREVPPLGTDVAGVADAMIKAQCSSPMASAESACPNSQPVLRYMGRPHERERAWKRTFTATAARGSRGRGEHRRSFRRSGRRTLLRLRPLG